MQKYLVSILFIGAFIAYAFYNNTSTQSTTASASAPSAQVTQTNSSDASNQITTPAPVSTPASTPVATPTTVATPVTVKKSTGQYVDGTYTGSVVDAYYGNIQVQATISGGKLTNVTFLQYPNDRNTSVQINKSAMPILAAEAIKAQSANVNGVSGASDSSTAFNQSLAAALAKATA